MKKLMIAAAVAGTAVAVQAQAAQWEIVESNIVRSELSLPFMGEGVGNNGFLPKASGFADTLAFESTDLDITVSGDSYTINGGTISLVGDTSIVAIGAEVFLSFNASGDALANGIILNNGTIMVDADTLPQPEPLDLSNPVNTVDMTSDGVLWGVQYAGIPLSSGVVNPDGSITITFAGIPALADPGLDMASAGGTLLGMDAAIFFEGSITLASDLQEIPLPGAAWLFGSALAGLGAARRRKARAVEA